MELLKCGQCGDRPGLLVTVKDRSSGADFSLCYDCYRSCVKHVKDGKAREPVAVEYEEGISARQGGASDGNRARNLIYP